MNLKVVILGYTVPDKPESGYPRDLVCLMKPEGGYPRIYIV